MPLEGITLDVYELLLLLIGVPTGITVPLTLFLAKVKNQGEQNHKCIERIEKNLDQHRLDLEKAKNDMEVQIKQLDMAISVIKENVVESKDIHRDIKEAQDKQFNFFRDWIQRVEDLQIPRRQRTRKKVG